MKLFYFQKLKLIMPSVESVNSPIMFGDIRNFVEWRQELLSFSPKAEHITNASVAQDPFTYNQIGEGHSGPANSWEPNYYLQAGHAG